MFKDSVNAYKRLLIRGGKILIAAEVASCLVSYLAWRKVNTNQDFRLYLYQNHNWALESYYKFGETISSSNSIIRQNDLETWRRAGQI